MTTINELKNIIKYCKEYKLNDSIGPYPYFLRSFAFDGSNMTSNEILQYENKLRIKYYEKKLSDILENR